MQLNPLSRVKPPKVIVFDEIVFALKEIVTSPLFSTEIPESEVTKNPLLACGLCNESECVTHNKFPLWSYFATNISFPLFDWKSKDGASENLTSQFEFIIP